VVVTAITFEGNKRTKERTILREMYFGVGDTVLNDDFDELLENSRNMVFNTALFNKVQMVHEHPAPGEVAVHVTVEERWYTFPIPVFSLVDRNFNVWWSEEDKDFGRTKYGIRFYQENVRGRNERLKLVAQLGWEHEFSASYKFPFFDKEQTHGVRFTVEHIRNREVRYFTESHKQLFYEGNEFIREKFKAMALFSRRKSINTTHYLEVSYHDNWITDSLLVRNPEYFLDSRKRMEYGFLGYELQIEKRNVKAYPTKGSYLGVKLFRYGLGIFNDVSLTEFTAEYAKYWELTKNTFFAARVNAKISGPTRQPYQLHRGLGYGENLVRGYELYVVEGQQYGLFRSSLRHKLLGFEIKRIPFFKVDQFKSIPFAFYPKIYYDMGYVNDEFTTATNWLHNRFLAGYGVGLDIRSWYDVVLRLEYSFNNLGQNGLYLHSSIDI
jgi:outer membrane protein assembly factor BamA